MTLSSDDVCFFVDCQRHQPVRDSRPGWLTDVERSALVNWFASPSFVTAIAAAQESVSVSVDARRARFEREATDVRRHTDSIPFQPWADDDRQQAALRYWLKRYAQPETPTLCVRVGGQRGRFSDPVEAMAELLDRVRWVGVGFRARCPSHEDRTPSLSVSRGRDNRMLLHCFAGCTVDDVLSAVGWRMVDLFGST